MRFFRLRPHRTLRSELGVLLGLINFKHAPRSERMVFLLRQLNRLDT